MRGHLSKSAGTVVQARNNAWRHWNSDGLFMIIQGFAVILLGLCIIWSHHQRSILQALLYLASMGIQADQLFTKKIVGWLKTYITFPRTGYVALPPFKELLSTSSLKEKRWIMWFLIWTAVLIVLASYLVFAHLPWYLVGAQIMMAVLLWFFWSKRKFAWYVPIPLLVGTLLLVLLPASSKDKPEILLAQLGAQHMLLGISILVQYLREHPVPQA